VDLALERIDDVVGAKGDAKVLGGQADLGLASVVKATGAT
jgi:hypothetical protein